ncbi:hypothetical protein [Lacinutrix mariniflava]|nr:hypothetical protein [Lacinutrix mariniflava]
MKNTIYFANAINALIPKLKQHPTITIIGVAPLNCSKVIVLMKS